MARQTLLPPCVVSAFASPPHDWRCIWRFLQAHPIRALTQSSAPCASASGMAWPKPCTMCCARSPTLGWCAAASRPARPDLAELRVGDNHHHSVCRRCDASADVDGVVGDTPCLRADADAIDAARGHLLGPMPQVCRSDVGLVRRVKADTQRATPAGRHSLGSSATMVASNQPAAGNTERGEGPTWLIGRT